MCVCRTWASRCGSLGVIRGVCPVVQIPKTIMRPVRWPVQDLGFQVWIMGVVSGCALGVSFLLAVVYLCVTIFSGASRHFRFISTPAA